MAIQSATSQNMIIQPTDLNPPKSNNELGQDEFLEILMTELQYQDPLEPMDDTEFISQLAEFSALEQMQAMNVHLASMQTSSMLGKTVSFNAIDASTGLPVLEEGTVESVVYQNGTTYLMVNGKAVNPEAVVEVSEPDQVDEVSDADQADGGNTGEEPSEV